MTAETLARLTVTLYYYLVPESHVRPFVCETILRHILLASAPIVVLRLSRKTDGEYSRAMLRGDDGGSGMSVF